jgi:hypothetical protein
MWKSRRRGSTHPLPDTFSCRGTFLFKHRRALSFYPGDGGSGSFWSVGNVLLNYRASSPSLHLHRTIRTKSHTVKGKLTLCWTNHASGHRPPKKISLNNWLLTRNSKQGSAEEEAMLTFGTNWQNLVRYSNYSQRPISIPCLHARHQISLVLFLRAKYGTPVDLSSPYALFASLLSPSEDIRI